MCFIPYAKGVYIQELYISILTDYERIMDVIYIPYIQEIYTIILIDPRSRSGRRTDAETVSKIIKQYTRQAFGKNVGNLVTGWNM